MEDYSKEQINWFNDGFLSIDDSDNVINYNLYPERRLLVAILERAVLDLNHKSKHIRKNSEAWIKADRIEDDLFSFEFVCSYLELDPVKVRSLCFR
jgi:hypothetical protein